MNNNINNIKNYSKLLFPSGPVQTSDFINNKYDVVHKELYNVAINSLIENFAKLSYNEFVLDLSKIAFVRGQQGYATLSENEGLPDYDKYSKAFIKKFKNTHKFIEIKKEEYFVPSDVIVINLNFPYERQRYNLKEYWNTIPEKRNNKDILIMQFNEDTTKYAELVYIDYVNGKCKFKSKLTGEEFWTTFDYTNNATKISDAISLKDTFIYKKENEIIKSEE